MKGLYILFFTFLSLSLSSQVFADNVTLFSFVTDPQTISLNTLSGDITIQSQNSSAVSAQVGETFDLVFTTSSATGQFLNSSGNTVSTTMSKNTSNRTFYYKDSSNGDFILTVSATGRDTKRVFTATQHIVVGTVNQISTATSSTSTTSTNTSNSTPTQTIVYVSSAHSDQAPIINTTVTPNFEVSAGRDRLTSVGNTLIFKATPTKIQNLAERNIGYVWSFGDGVTAQGDTVSHNYRFGGDYVVILNAKSSDISAVARVNVKVITPDLSLERVLGGISITNKSNTEINLEGWVISNEALSFTFPKDTLISAGKKVVFADDVTRINSNSFYLANPLGVKYVAIAEVPTAISNLVIVTPISPPQPEIKKEVVRVISKPLNKNIPQNIVKKIETATSTKQTASVIFSAPQSRGFASILFAIPIKGFDLITSLFTER